MRRTTLSVTILILALALVQISTPCSLGSFIPITSTPAVAAAPMDPLPINTLTQLTFDQTNTRKTYRLSVSEPTQYSFDMSYYANDSGSSWPSLSISIRGSGTQYVPHLNQQIDSMSTIWSDLIWFIPTGASGTDYDEFLAIQPGLLILDFDFDIGTLTNRLLVNFTFSELYSLSSANQYDSSETITTSWTEDDSWAASQFSLADANMYNLTMFAEIDYVTTTGWGGNPNFQPFMGVTLIDDIYGGNLPYGSFYPSFNIPSGAGSGTANWSISSLYKLIPTAYYLIGEIGGFEFLNGTSVTINVDIFPVVNTILEVNQTLEFSFDSGVTTNIAYVGLHAPQQYVYKLYFDGRIGSNWSVECYDIDVGWMPPSFLYYNDASSYTQVDYRLENGFAFVQPSMLLSPQSTLTGEEYLEIYGFGGTSSLYINDTISVAAFTPNFYQNFLDTFYLYITAAPYSGTPTPEFNITLNFEAYETPVFQPSNTFAVNQTVGPFYKAFALPVISGQEYELSAWASDYNTSGVAGLFIAPSPQFYLDWQWTSYPGVYETTPEGMSPIQVSNVNDTAGIRFVAVRTTTLFIGVMGVSMSGPPPSDTEEVTVTMAETPPAPYTLGLAVTEDLTDSKFQSYSVAVAAGTSYRLSLSLDAGGNFAFCSVFNGLGFTPFDATMITLWVQADSSFLNTSVTYQAIFSGPVTIILLSDGSASFALVPIGEAPGSFMLGLMIGLIFMIGGVIIVYVLMRRRF